MRLRNLASTTRFPSRSPRTRCLAIPAASPRCSRNSKESPLGRTAAAPSIPDPRTRIRGKHWRSTSSFRQHSGSKLQERRQRTTRTTLQLHYVRFAPVQLDLTRTQPRLEAVTVCLCAFFAPLFLLPWTRDQRFSEADRALLRRNSCRNQRP